MQLNYLIKILAVLNLIFAILFAEISFVVLSQKPTIEPLHIGGSLLCIALLSIVLIITTHHQEFTKVLEGIAKV